MTRTHTEREEEPARQAAGDYFVVGGPEFTVCVSTTMARHIEACLDTWPRRDWITFVDISGARIRLRARQIQSIFQSTVEQRQKDRDFSRALHREKQADRRPDEY